MPDTGPVPAGLPVPIRSKPGIDRDSTSLASSYYNDGEWVRWDDCNDGSCQKIGGLQSRSSFILNIPRGINVFPNSGFTYVHVGSQAAIQSLTIQQSNGAVSIPVDRTPAADFTAAALNLWQLDQLYASTITTSVILAHPGQNLVDIASDVTSPIFYGAATATTPLIKIVGSDVSGGMAAIGPFMFYYGSNGFLGWSQQNDPTMLTGGLSGTANPGAQKIVKGLQIRGGTGNAPAGIFWALDTVYIASFTGGTVAFNIDTVSGQSTILSSSCPVEYDGIFYWIGTGRFLMFNGVVQENMNRINKRDFFNNLNFAQRQKVFGFKVESKGEIWWCYPRGTSTECNWAIIFNVRLQTWYDTPLPINVSSGTYAEVYPYPLVGGTAADAVTTFYKIFQTETGVDLVDGSDPPTAIRSFWETADLSPVAAPILGVPIVRGLTCEAVAPDFLQDQSMNFYVNGKSTANGPDNLSTAFPFLPPPQTGADALIHPKLTRNQMRFRFESNTLGGNYTTGNPIAYLRASDGRSET